MWKILRASRSIAQLVMSHYKPVLKEGERGAQQSQKQGQCPELPCHAVAREGSTCEFTKVYEPMREAPHGPGTRAQGSAIPCHRNPTREKKQSSLLCLAV